MGAGEGAFRPAHLTARAEGRPRPAALGPILALATLWLLGTATVALGFPAYTTTFDAKYGTAGSALSGPGAS